MPLNNTPQTGTPSSTTLATTLVSSSIITGTAFSLGIQKDPLDEVSIDTGKTGRNPIAPMRVIYGERGQLGGTLTYVTTSPTTDTQHALGVDVSQNGNIHMVITMAGHQIQGFLGGEVTDYRAVTATVPLVIYLDGYKVPLTVNGAPAFGGDSFSYVDFLGLAMSSSLAPTDNAYYVPTDYRPPNLPNGSQDKAHDYRWRIRVEIDNGDPTNTSQPFPLLASDTVTGNPGSWDSTCLQRGRAKAHVQMIWDATRFNNGLPNITFDIAGKLVYDPRLSPPASQYSTNPALCLRDWLTDTAFGLGIPTSLIDDSLVIAAANICDEAVVLREGGTQPRYTCAGVFDASMETGQVVTKLLESMAGMLMPPGNVWKMYAGAFRDSVLSLTDSDLRGPIKIDTAVSRRDIANAVKGTYISPDNQWQSSDYPPYVNITYVEADGGTATLVGGHYTYTGLIFTDLTLDFVTDAIQAQRLAKIKLNILRRQSPLVIPAKLNAFRAEAGDTITFSHARWGISNATYLVTNTSLVRDDSGDVPVLGYDLVCIPWDSTVYEWDPDVDEGTVVICTAPLLPDNSNVGPPQGIGSPAGLFLESDSTTTITRADGIAHSQILVEWGLSLDATVLNGGYYEIFIKKVSDPGSAYLFAGSVAGNITKFYIDNNITDGIDYDVYVQSLNAAGSHSDPLGPASIVCSGAASSVVGTGAPGPVGVFNNDFEASDALPPSGWTVKGSPTLGYEISSQQQGIRSLKITSHTAGEGVYTTSKYAVVPGDTFTGESWKVGGYIKGDGTGHGIICFRFFDASDTELPGTAVIADGGNPTPAEWNFYSAVALAPNEAVYARVFLQNETGTSNTLEFDSIVLFRVASLEDEVANGPSRGAITAANSSYRPLTNPLTAHDDGTSCEIDIAAFTMRTAIGPKDMSINSGSITGLGYHTVYHVYYDDPTYAGGAVTYYCNTSQVVALDATGRFYVGSILTPTVGGIDTVGNNDGGTGAQSGITYELSPTLRADYDAEAGAVTWYPANAEDSDADTSTYVAITQPDTIWLGGIPNNFKTKWSSLILKVLSGVPTVDNGGIAFCDYSLDDGGTWTNIFNVENGAQDVELPTSGVNSGSGTAWTNPGNITDPTNYATITGLAHGLTSKNDKATGFPFSISSGSVIDGISLTFDEQCGGSAFVAGEVPEFNVQLLKAGTPVGVVKNINGVATTTLKAGDDTDLWGTTWSATDINNANFGFEVSVTTPVAPGSWSAGTYYSPLAIIIDSNNNIQQVVTPGTSGASAPSWNTTLSGTTTDNGVTWVCLQLHTSLTWAASHDITSGGWRGTGDPTNPLDTGHFVKATAAGSPCIFELTPGRMPRLGNVTLYFIPTNSSQKGSCNVGYPAGNPPAAATRAINPVSLHWTSNYGVTYEMSQYVVNGNGTLGSGIDMGVSQNWQGACVGQMYFPKKGVYNFNLQHDDGAVIAFDTTLCKVTSCPRGVGNVYMGPKAPVTGYPWVAGSNASTTYSTGYDSFSIPPGPYSPYDVWNEFFSISVNADNSVIGFEIGYTNWEHNGHMILLCQDANGTYQDIVPVSTDLTTSATAPAWPAWSTATKPSWPSVMEAAGNLVWVNRGPATDFAWHASTEFTAAGTEIIDSNGYGQKAYEAGVSGTTAPAFATATNNLTSDGTGSLKWINDGTRNPLTYFDFSIRNAAITVNYVPPTAVSSRAKQVDSITLSLAQNLNKIQVRYGLDLQAGEFDMYEVWVEAQAG